MSVPIDWQTAFLAVSVLLGEPLDVAQAALGVPESAGARELHRELSGAGKVARARTVARVMTSILNALDDAGPA